MSTGLKIVEISGTKNNIWK